MLKATVKETMQTVKERPSLGASVAGCWSLRGHLDEWQTQVRR